MLVSIEEANAIIDVWETLQHESMTLTPARAERAYEMIDWLRRSITAMGEPERYTRWELVMFSFMSWVTNFRFRLLRWRNRHAVFTLMLTREERSALLKFLVLQKPEANLYPVIERLKVVGHAGRTAG